VTSFTEKFFNFIVGQLRHDASLFIFRKRLVISLVAVERLIRQKLI